MKLFYDFGIAQLKKFGEELCGDSVEIFKTDEADIVVMSDGLGSGVKANILSTITVKTAGTMLKMGGQIDEVIETIASTLPICKERKLAYSTFSVAQLRKDGRTYLVEYDNPAAFFGHRQRLITPHTVTRTIGGKRINETFYGMRDGDWLVIISDGILHAGVGMVMNMVWGRDRIGNFLEHTASPEKSASEWAEEVANLCYNLYGEKPGDDATVVVVKARQPRYVTVMIGPPRFKEDDRKVVDMLMNGPGAKVVCGGTTSNIVGRVLGRKVAIDLSSNDKNIPPCGMLPGIDLVTEGAVTLVYAVEHLKYGTKISELKSKRDGASRLAVLLKEADSIHFIIGTAENPALQGIGVPAIYTYKQHVIRDLISVLKAQGKTVKETYY